MSAPVPSLESEASGQGASAAKTETGIETCGGLAGLAAINRPDRDLVIWARALPLCLTAWLEGLEASCLPDLRVLVRPGDFRAAVEPQLDGCGMPPGDMRDLLIGDADALVAAFSQVTGSDLVDVRLERVSHDACWKFHRDSVEARLVTTYRGPGTEWVRPGQAEQALQEQKQFKGPLEQLRLHEVAVFKGSRAGTGRGIVHRSPPVAGTGQTRLLLCLNRPSHVSPEPWPQA
ncbi:DUF1826 domain-containing protein [Denitrobaculum tricleocarpae]|uniref:DUF1826 domain-containing protein n=1 Tax=Denitrobaculum tricleocarpae TaxID=2591009 RepID=A0A545SXR4_9PROT|nr:DUF1826 domain-containing protein [Denitrobaculum tricleocarpae]TQV69729.1 DUF1826 domain-containing protein [Denitrobaculum tricleocarpae]